MNRDLQLPAQVTSQYFGDEQGKFHRTYEVVGPNLVVWCKCKDRDSAETIAHALNQLPRAPIEQS
jgi:hypothetical protein